MSILRSGNEQNGLALVLDIGGTKVAAGVVDCEGRIVHRVRQLWASEDSNQRLEQTIQIAEELRATAPRRFIGVGVGVPAALDCDGTIEWAPNLAGWTGLPLRQLLRQRLELPCWIGHDGQLAALGEYWYGAGRGAQSLAMVVVGTGIGGGLVLGGKIYGGASGQAGAGLGWVVPDQAALVVKDFARNGSLEARASGAGLASQAAHMVVAEPDGVLARLVAEHPDEASARTLFIAAERGEARAVELLREAADLVAILVANLVTVLSPQIVALGGSIGLHEMMLERAREVTMSCSMPSCRSSTTIVTAELGGDAGLLGAARQVFAGQ